MAIWDKASWQGPPDANHSGQMSEFRGLIWHIAEGSYLGTIGWQQNPISDVSSHFIIGLNQGEIAQMLDTTQTAWTQAAGNGHWVSVEFAGFATGQLTTAQFEAAAQLYAWLVHVHGVPVQLAEDPSGRGLGWHGMGGTAWGGHPNCPGPANVALRPSNLVRVAQILGQGPSTEEIDMPAVMVQDNTGIAVLWTGGSQMIYQNVVTLEMVAAWNQAGVPGPFPVTNIGDYGTAAHDSASGGGSGGGATPAQVSAAVRAELDKTKLTAIPGKLGV
jgi:hypothetical protein